jgi:hypothetical protein
MQAQEIEPWIPFDNVPFNHPLIPPEKKVLGGLTLLRKELYQGYPAQFILLKGKNPNFSHRLFIGKDMV